MVVDLIGAPLQVLHSSVPQLWLCGQVPGCHVFLWPLQPRPVQLQRLRRLQQLLLVVRAWHVLRPRQVYF